MPKTAKNILKAPILFTLVVFTVLVFNSVAIANNEENNLKPALNTSTGDTQKTKSSSDFSDAKIKFEGVVLDGVDRQPLIGANVIDIATKVGTTTDLDGRFDLSLEEGSVVLISYIGYLDKKVTISGGGLVEILLPRQENMIDEVVVVGYGSQRKSDLTGSVSSIGTK